MTRALAELPRYLIPYYRVSTDNKGQDTDRQRIACEPWAEREGFLLLPAEHEEESAFKVPSLQRLGFVAACERAKASKAEGILLETPDRFSREDPEIAIWQKVEVLRKYDVKLYFACMSLEMQTTPMGKCFLFMQQTSGHVWVVDHSKKILTGNIRARQRGVKLGRKPKAISFEDERLIDRLRAPPESMGWEKIEIEVNKARGVFDLTDKKLAKQRSISASALKRWDAARRAAQNSDETGEVPMPVEMTKEPEDKTAAPQEAVSDGGA